MGTLGPRRHNPEVLSVIGRLSAFGGSVFRVHNDWKTVLKPGTGKFPKPHYSLTQTSLLPWHVESTGTGWCKKQHFKSNFGGDEPLNSQRISL